MASESVSNATFADRTIRDVRFSDYQLEGGEICWRVKREDPIVFSQGFGGLQILNPFISPIGWRPAHRKPRRSPVVRDDVALVWTNRIFFLSDGSTELSASREVMEDLVPSIIAALRAVSMQRGLRVYPDAGGSGYVREATVRFPAGSDDAARVTNMEFDTAVSIDTAREAIRRLNDGDFDVENIVLLDAQEAWVYCDYRTSVLYAASAIEIAANRVIDREAGSRNGFEDSVLKALPDRFGNLLHERMLYVAGRSLRADSMADYQQALRLYRTRNAIIHRGSAGVPDQIPLTSQGARDGIAIAERVFQWLGLAPPLTVRRGSVDGKWVKAVESAA